LFPTFYYRYVPPHLTHFFLNWGFGVPG
jgi:hypothetical protein